MELDLVVEVDQEVGDNWGHVCQVTSNPLNLIRFPLEKLEQAAEVVAIQLEKSKSMIKFVSFGKEGCPICVKRVESIQRILNRRKETIPLEYVDVGSGVGLARLLIEDLSEDIPVTVAYNADNNEQIKVWDIKDVPTHKVVSALIDKYV